MGFNMLIGEKFRAVIGYPIDMKLSVSPVAIGVAAVIALITVLISAWIPSKRATKVSAVEAIRQNLDVRNTKPVKTSKLTYKFFGLSGVLANKHYKRNKKKYRTTVVSLFMSIVLFVSASAFTDYLMETVGVGFASAGYDMTIHISGNEFDKISPEELLNRMKSAKSVTNGAYSQDRYAFADISSDYLTKEGTEFFDSNNSMHNTSSNIINRLDFGKKYCHNSPTVEESILQRAVMRAIMETAQQNLGVLQTLKVHIGMALENEPTEDNSMELQIRIAEIDAEFKAMLSKISTETVDAFDEEKAKRLMDEKVALQQQLADIQDGQLKREQTQTRLDDIYTILDGLKNRPMEYDEQIVRQLLECITVDSKEQITVIFVGGLKVVQPLID